MPVRSLWRAAALAFVCGTLAACGGSGIGEGNALQSLRIAKRSGVLGADNNKSFLCFRDSLQLIGTFTDGSQGDFSDRARWTTSNPDKVQVSNGDILAVPGDPTQGAFLHGTIIPVATTTTGESVTITAEFVGLRASYDVVVGKAEAGSLKLLPSSQPTASTPVEPQNVAVGANEAIIATALFDGFKVNVTSAADWELQRRDGTTDDTIDEIATIGRTNGVIRGIAAGELRAKPVFTACEGLAEAGELNADDPAAPTFDITVATPTDLAIDHEFDADTTSAIGQLVINTTERFRVRALFGSGPDQDVSGSVVMLSSQPTSDTTQFFLSPAAGIRSAVQALSAGSASFTACFDTNVTENDGDAETETTGSCGDTDPNDVRSSTPVALTAVAGTLQAVEILPAENAKIGAQQVQQFRARGTFRDAAATECTSGCRTQDVTRHVAWTSSDTAVAVVSNAPASAGLGISTRFVDGTVTVTATGSSGISITPAPTDTTTLCIYAPPADPAAQTCTTPAP